MNAEDDSYSSQDENETAHRRMLQLLLRNRSSEWSSTLPQSNVQVSLVVVCYSLLVLVSLFGNCLVCSTVMRNGRLRSSATYVFIVNLAVSDLLMTVLNVPFNVARTLLGDWPFGACMCSLVPLVQVTSVYVSTFTMTTIALDRYRIVSEPLRPRITSSQALKAVAWMWLLSIFLSLPHAIFNRLEMVFTYRLLVRCRTLFPAQWRRWWTLTTVLTQYGVPLSVTGALYCAIITKVWIRGTLGATTEGQLAKQAKAKRKTIKMLFLVVVLFALCWLPLNLFNLFQEFGATPFLSASPSTFYFVCHWLAMSSVCYNPFIYCWLNQHFRDGAVRVLHCIKRRKTHRYSSRCTHETCISHNSCKHQEKMQMKSCAVIQLSSRTKWRSFLTSENEIASQPSSGHEEENV